MFRLVRRLGGSDGSHAGGPGVFLAVAVVVAATAVAPTGEGMPMKARLVPAAAAAASSGLLRNGAYSRKVYERMDNKGMFAGDVRAGIGLSENGDGSVDFSNDPMRHYTHWPLGVIHYTIDASADELFPTIKSAMGEMMRKTCIRFKERKQNDAHIKNFIYITADDPVGGCWSSVGMDTRQSQTMNLERPTCWDKGVILHELVHTIGFYHEHQRPDRDKYIEVLFKNVQDGIEPHQFSKLPWSKLMDTGVPYDLDSIMHYDTHAFGREDSEGRQLPTIVQKPPNHREMLLPIWARPFLSRLDAVEIDAVYKDECRKREASG